VRTSQPSQACARRSSTPSRDPLVSDLVTAFDVVGTRDRVLGFLRPLRGRDWGAPVPDLEWNCKETLRHAINTQLWYAAHLASRSTRRLAVWRDVDPGLDIDGLLDNLEAHISVLAAVIRDAPPEARSWHNSGMTDPGGYSAMACDELLIHTWDIGRGLDAQFDMPGDLCGRVVARLFPMWRAIHAAPEDALLWCNGRIALPDRARLGPDWGWWSRPLEEWDGTDPDA
jgi:uncharacterized protein (TIGR03083 family)